MKVSMKKLFQSLFLSVFILVLILFGVTTSKIHAYDPDEQAQKCTEQGKVYDADNNTCKGLSVRVGPCGADAPSDRFSKLCNASQGQKTPIIIRNVLMGIMMIAAILALFFLVWGGFKWLSSGGDKAKIDAARQTIIAAILGLVLTFLTFFVLSVVLGVFGLSFQDLSIPTLPR